MKTSNSSTPRPRTAPAFLFRGPPGGGKTTFALQFPNLWVGDIDLNLNGPEAHLRKVNPTMSYLYDTITLDDDGNRILDTSGAYAWPAIWLRCKQKTLEALKHPDIKVLFLDGLTQLNSILVQKILAEQKATIMEIQHWIPFRNELMKLVMQCRHSGKIIIMSAHEEASVDRQGSITDWHIAVSSRLKDVFGGIFTDIYSFESFPTAKGERKFVLNTSPDARRKDVKTSYPTMPIQFDVTVDGFAKVNKYLQL